MAPNERARPCACCTVRPSMDGVLCRLCLDSAPYPADCMHLRRVSQGDYVSAILAAGGM